MKNLCHFWHYFNSNLRIISILINVFPTNFKHRLVKVRLLNIQILRIELNNKHTEVLTMAILILFIAVTFISLGIKTQITSRIAYGTWRLSIPLIIGLLLLLLASFSFLI